MEHAKGWGGEIVNPIHAAMSSLEKQNENQNIDNKCKITKMLEKKKKQAITSSVSQSVNPYPLPPTHPKSTSLKSSDAHSPSTQQVIIHIMKRHI